MQCNTKIKAQYPVRLQRTVPRYPFTRFGAENDVSAVMTLFRGPASPQQVIACRYVLGRPSSCDYRLCKSKYSLAGYRRGNSKEVDCQTKAIAVVHEERQSD